MPWKVTAFNFGWPPSATISFVEGEFDVLHRLFVNVVDRRLLLFGYGPTAGITDLEDLRRRVDEIRGHLQQALLELSPDSTVAGWLEKLQDASNELVNMASEAIYSGADPGFDEVDPAVDEFREAFALAAHEVDSQYRIRQARRLADVIQKS